MEPEIANLLKSQNGNIVKKDVKGGLMMACKGEWGQAFPSHFCTPSPALCLDYRKVILEDMESGVRVRITREDTCIVSKDC